MPVFKMGWEEYHGKLITIVTRNYSNHESLTLRGFVVGIKKMEDGVYICITNSSGKERNIKTEGILYFVEGDL